VAARQPAVVARLLLLNQAELKPPPFAKLNVTQMDLASPSFLAW